MDLIDRINDLASRIPKQMEHIQTEEATKNAFVLPFISALGYDVFNPTEVIPEFTADTGTKKGEKVDYAIKKERNDKLWAQTVKPPEPVSNQRLSKVRNVFANRQTVSAMPVGWITRKSSLTAAPAVAWMVCASGTFLWFRDLPPHPRRKAVRLFQVCIGHAIAPCRKDPNALSLFRLLYFQSDSAMNSGRYLRE